MFTDARTINKVIVFDGNKFWLRITTGQNVQDVDLASVTLPGAFKIARRLGHEPRHWCRLDLRAQEIPTSIIRD